MIGDATKNLEAQNKVLENKLDGLRSQLTIISVLLTIIGLAIAGGPIVLKFLA